MLGQGIKDHFFLLTIQLMLNVGMSVLLQLGRLNMTIKVILSRVLRSTLKDFASQSKVKQTVSGLLKPDGCLTVNDIDTANTLNNFFGSVFALEVSAGTPSFGDLHLGNSFSTNHSYSRRRLESVVQTTTVYINQVGQTINCHPRVCHYVYVLVSP